MVFVVFVGFALIWLVFVAFDWFWFGIALFDLVWSGLNPTESPTQSVSKVGSDRAALAAKEEKNK